MSSVLFSFLVDGPAPPWTYTLHSVGSVRCGYGTEMHLTFNCGLGMIVVLPKEKAQEAIDILNAEGETATLVGRIEAANEGDELVIVKGVDEE